MRDSLVEMNRREKANREWIRSPHTKEYLKKFRDEVVCSSTRKSEGFSRENFRFKIGTEVPTLSICLRVLHFYLIEHSQNDEKYSETTK